MNDNQVDYVTAQQGLGKLPCYHANESEDIFQFLKEAHLDIEKIIETHGGILLRNFDIRSVSEFNRFVNQYNPNLLDYVYRSTPRTRLGGKIYTTTEYPPSRTIPLHNENSYTSAWPKRILFFCVVSPETGGETPVADSRMIYKKMKKELVEKFDEKKIKYVRNYTLGIDLSWQNVFQTEDKAEVERYCNDNQINFIWHDGSDSSCELTTWQICQASLMHPEINQPVWFNQAHLFHHSALEEEDRTLLQEYLKKGELPRQAYFGDGSDISENEIQAITKIYDEEKIVFPWQRSDILILDNMLMAHGRNPFTGDRKVVVAMSS